jgi:hypothetical protein
MAVPNAEPAVVEKTGVESDWLAACLCLGTGTTGTGTDSLCCFVHCSLFSLVPLCKFCGFNVVPRVPLPRNFHHQTAASSLAGFLALWVDKPQPPKCM